MRKYFASQSSKEKKSYLNESMENILLANLQRKKKEAIFVNKSNIKKLRGLRTSPFKNCFD